MNVNTYTYIYYNTIDPTREILGRIKTKSEYLAAFQFSEKKQLPIYEFLKIFTVEREER